MITDTLNVESVKVEGARRLHFATQNCATLFDAFE